MPRGYWRFIVAAVGWLILAGVNHPAEQQKGVESAQQASLARAVNTTPTPTATYTPYPNRYAEACYTAPDHDTADLCAQWRAAVAAEKAAQEAGSATTWAAVATILSAIGVAGLIYTIWQTQGALGEARRGNRITLDIEKRARRESRAAAADTKAALAIAERNANATETAANETQRIGEAQIRCYLSCTSAKLGALPDKGIIVLCTVQNFGRSPARGVRCAAKLNYFMGTADSVDGVNGSPLVRERDISAGTSYEFNVGTFSISPSPGMIAVAQQGGEYILISLEVIITATDVFGRTVTADDKLTVLAESLPSTGWVDLKPDGRTKYLSKSEQGEKS